MEQDKKNLKFTGYAALSLVILTLVTWGLAMIAVPPAGPYCPGDCMEYPFSGLLDYYPRDYYWMYFSIFQLFAYLIFMISMHYLSSVPRKLYSLIAVAFTLVASIVLLLAYFIQFSVVPASMLHGETEGIALITQYNGHGIFIAMEDLGYIAMSISFFFLAFSMPPESRPGKSVRFVFTLALPLVALTFLYYSLRFGIDRSYRFEVVAISINWLVILVGGTLIYLWARKGARAS
jgi:hypothetical protein